MDRHPAQVAFEEMLVGVREIPGSGSNPRIDEYLRDVGLGPGDEIPWCSAFVNWCFDQVGLVGTKHANARSWLTFGVATEAPRAGDVVVLWRGSMDSWKGYVGFFLGESPIGVFVLAGNQDDRVSIAEFDKSRVLGYRRAV